MSDDKFEMFTERYKNGDAPWDSGITPPEIVAIMAELAAGTALDLGCGTGTNVRYLLEHDWQADGVDFIQQAVDMAHSKLADFDSSRWRVYRHDVTQLDTLDSLRPPYDLVVDIGCGHGLPADKQAKYAHDIASLLADGGTFMLYAVAPSENRPFGWTPDDVKRLFTPHLTLVEQTISTDVVNGSPSGWYRFRR